MLGKRKRKVLMHMDTGPTIEGLLLGRSHGEYVLGATTLSEDESEGTPLAGEIRIPVGRVPFYQVVS